MVTRMIGPITRPMNPKAAAPPSRPKKITRPLTCVRPLNSSGRSTLSTMLMPSTPTSSMITPRAGLAGQQQPEAGRRPHERGADDRNQRAERQHHAPEHRGAQPQQPERQAPDRALGRRDGQARADAGDHQIARIAQQPVAIRRRAAAAGRAAARSWTSPSRSMKKSAKSIARSDPSVAKTSVMTAPACGTRNAIVRRAPSARSSVGSVRQRRPGCASLIALPRPVDPAGCGLRSSRCTYVGDRRRLPREGGHQHRDRADDQDGGQQRRGERRAGRADLRREPGLQAAETGRRRSRPMSAPRETARARDR